MNPTFARAIARRPLLWLGWLGAVAAPAALASDPVELRWADLRVAAHRHPGIAAAAADLAAAEAELATIARYPNPEIGLALGEAREDESGARGRIWEAEASLLVPSPFARSSRVASARAQAAAVAEEAAGAQAEVLAGLRTLVWEIDHGQEDLRLLANSQAQVARLAEVARLRVTHGEARPMEADQLAVELARAELAVQGAAARQEARKRVLALWLPDAVPAEFRVASELSRLPELPLLETALVQAAARQPALLAAESRADAATHAWRAERRARWPELTAGAFYEQELEGESYGARLELALPLWDWNGPAIRQARAAAARAEHRYLQEAGLLAAAVRETHATATAARERARRYRDELAPKAAQTAAVLEQMYQVGEADVFDLLAARREAIEIESEMWAALLETQLASLQLTLWMGGEDHE